jgi:hypothetical protein
MAEAQYLDEKLLVSSLLFASSGKASAIIDSFSNWLLAGFAAAITFLLGNIESLSDYLPGDTLQYCAYLFFVVLVLGIIEKIIATVVASASAGATVGRQIASQNLDSGAQLQASVIFSESLRAVLPPMRWFVARSFRKTESGDVTAAARAFTKCAQAQGLLVVAQVACVLRAVYVIADTVAF